MRLRQAVGAQAENDRRHQRIVAGEIRAGQAHVEQAGLGVKGKGEVHVPQSRGTWPAVPLNRFTG